MKRLRAQVRCAMRGLGKLLAVLVGVVIVEQIVETTLMMWAMRSRSPRAMKLLTSYHKHVTNPGMVRFFSGRSAHAGLLHHVGRRSGKAYLTPVTAHRSEDTIIVPLPYGAEVDWLRNLRVAGQSVMELEGRSFTVNEPEVVPVDRVLPVLPSFVARIVQLHDTKQALRLHVAGPAWL